MINIKTFLKTLYILTLCFSLSYFVIDRAFPSLHVIATVLQYIAFISTFFFWIKNRKKLEYPKLFRYFIYFYIAYSVLIFCYLTILRKIPLDEMLGCPPTIKDFILNTFILLFLLLFLPLLKYINQFNFLYKSYIYLNTLSMLYLCNRLGEQDLSSLPLMISCTTSSVALITLVSNKLYPNKWNRIMSILIIIACIISWAQCNKRGPVLYFILSYLFIYISRNKNNKVHLLLSIVLCVSILIFFNSIIIDILINIAPELADRFKDTIVSGDTSGRLGSDDSGYVIAINQIMDNPWYGTYFRLTIPFSIWTGAYPHNLFLELMMTFGIIGTIPFVIFIIKAFNNCYYNFQHISTTSLSVINLFFSALFINAFLSLMSTGTPLLNRTFWISLGAILYFDNEKRKL